MSQKEWQDACLAAAPAGSKLDWSPATYPNVVMPDGRFVALSGMAYSDAMAKNLTPAQVLGIVPPTTAQVAATRAEQVAALEAAKLTAGANAPTIQAFIDKLKAQWAAEDAAAAAPKPPAPVAAPPENLDPFLENGKWFRYSLFGLKVRCEAPPAPAVVFQGFINYKAPIYSKIEAMLAEDPPKSDATVNALIEVYSFVTGMKI